MSKARELGDSCARDSRATEDVDQEVVPSLLLNVALLESGGGEVRRAVTERVDEELRVREVSSVLDLSFRFGVVDVLFPRVALNRTCDRRSE